MKKLTAVILTLLMVVTIIPFSALAEVDFDYSISNCDFYNIIEKNDYQLAPGAVESEIVINDDSGNNRNVVHVMEIDVSNPNISIMPGQKNISEDVDYNDKANWGTQIVRDHVTHAEENLGVNVIGAMNVSLTWSFEHPYGLLLYKGKVLYDDRANSPGGGYLVITKDGKAELREAKAPLTGNEWMAQTVCFTWLVRNGVSKHASENHVDSGRAPRSVIGIKADGTLVLMMNDGRLSPYSAGFTNHEMAETMMALGCVDVINCDGGGSSTFITEREGTGELVMRSKPSDGAERETLSSILVLANEVESDGNFDHATIKGDDYITAESKTTFTADGFDVAGAPATIPSSATWKVKDSAMGTITKKGEFTVANKVGSTVVQLVYQNKVIAEKTIYITPKTDDTSYTGWIGEMYFANGVKYTGIKQVGGYYYNFGSNGICKGKAKYTGVFKDGDVYKYVYLGTFKGGWNMIGPDWYYFDETTCEAVSEKRFFNAVTYKFEETGKLVSGEWVLTNYGYKYYYGPDCYSTGFETIDGKTYYFNDTYKYEKGIHVIKGSVGNDILAYEFGENGVLIGEYKGTGLVTTPEGKYYIVNGVAKTGLHYIDGNYYYFNTSYGYAYVYRTYNVTITNGYNFTAGTYEFDENGAIVDKNGYYEESGVTYYYQDNVRIKNALVKIDGDYYYLGSDGQIFKNGKQYVSTSVCDLPTKVTYYFGADGKALQGVVEGKLYINGALAATGLHKIGDDYYYSEGGKVIASKKYYASKSNCELPAKVYYYFDADGKALKGVVDGKLYINGELAATGLTKYGEDYYYSESGKVIVNSRYYAAKSNCELAAKDYYNFGPDGKMLQGVVNGKLYIYGQPAKRGLTEYKGDYYYSESGTVIVGKRYYAAISNCELKAKDYYFFGADGKMLQGVVDGKLYIKGQIAPTGLTKYGEDYYYSESGKVIAGKRYYVAKTNCELPAKDYYFFGADGKMLQGPVDGKLYVKGQIAATGLTKYGDDYYYSESGSVVTGKYYIAASNCELPTKVYCYFAEDGKMLEGVVDGKLYISGQLAPTGLTKYGDDYYYSEAGKVITGKKYYVSKSFCELPAKDYYYFGVDGKMLEGVVDGYLYIGGKRAATGLTKYNGKYYYSQSGKLAVGKCLAKVSNCDLEAGVYYYFGEDGTFCEGIYTESDGVYYYENGKRTFAGLVKVGDDFYYAGEGGKCTTDKKVLCRKSSCVLPINREYTFGTDGKIVK